MRPKRTGTTILPTEAGGELAGTKVVYPSGHPLAGQPMRMFHVTSRDIKVFDTSRFRSHFGNEAQSAQRAREKLFLGGASLKLRTIPVYLNIRDPFRIHDLGNAWGSPHWWLEALAALEKKHINMVNKEYDEIFNRLRDKNNEEPVIRMLEARGYDGVVYANQYEGVNADNFDHSQPFTGETSGDSYIPFYPHQIINAIIECKRGFSAR